MNAAGSSKISKFTKKKGKAPSGIAPPPPKASGGGRKGIPLFTILLLLLVLTVGFVYAWQNDLVPTDVKRKIKQAVQAQLAALKKTPKKTSPRSSSKSAKPSNKSPQKPPSKTSPSPKSATHKAKVVPKQSKKTSSSSGKASPSSKSNGSGSRSPSPAAFQGNPYAQLARALGAAPGSISQQNPDSYKHQLAVTPTQSIFFHSPRYSEGEAIARSREGLRAQGFRDVQVLSRDFGRGGRTVLSAEKNAQEMFLSFEPVSSAAGEEIAWQIDLYRE